MTTNANGRGWTLTTFGIVFSTLGLLTSNVVANDRKREDSDEKLQESIAAHSAQLAELRESSANIKSDLSEIKQLLVRTTPFQRR